jgi:peroxiredoxin
VAELRQPSFRGRLVLVGVVLGLIGGGAVVLWQHPERLLRERLSLESLLPSQRLPLPADNPPSMLGDSGPANALSSGQVPMGRGHTPRGLEPLFTALGIHRPVEPITAFAFTLPDLDGRPVHLREFLGKLVLLNFWATWCAPCLQEMPSMERLYQMFKQTDFVLLAVSMDRQGAQAAKPYVERLQLSFPVLVDYTNDIGRQYGVRGLPSTYLIDPNGRLLGAAVGARDWYRTEAKALIAGILRQASGQTTDPLQVQR